MLVGCWVLGVGNGDGGGGIRWRERNVPSVADDGGGGVDWFRDCAWAVCDGDGFTLLVSC